MGKARLFEKLKITGKNDTLKEESTLKEIQELLSEEDDIMVVNLISRIKRLVPNWTEKKVEYLYEIITFVDTLLNGDEITTTVLYESSDLKYAKKALQELLEAIPKEKLEEYNKEKMAVKKEVSSLINKRENLTQEVDTINKKKDDLQEQNRWLLEEKNKLQKEIEELKNNSIKQAEEEIAAEKTKLQEKIKLLKKEKDDLVVAIEELKNNFNMYTSNISSITEMESVTWEPIKDDDPIYETNYKTIESYVNAIQMEYMDRTGASKEVCTREFNKYCPGLDELIVSVKYFSDSSMKATTSIREILQYEYWVSNCEHIANSIRAILKTLKFPKYHQKVTNRDVQSVTTDTIPKNINALMRELYFQRMALEATAKQKFAEAELNTVIGFLESMVPEGLDLTELLPNYNKLNGILPEGNNTYSEGGEQFRLK